MRFVSPSSVAALALLGLLAAVPFHVGLRDDYTLETRITTSRPGRAQVYFDNGQGLSELSSAQQMLPRAGESIPVRLKVPEARFTQWRFDPLDGAGELRIEPLRLLNSDGDVLRTFTFADLVSGNQIASAADEVGLWVIQTTPAADDPQFYLRFSPPLDLRPTTWQRLFGFCGTAVIVWIAGVLLLTLLHFLRRQADWWEARARWIREHPVATLGWTAALAAIISTYPVIFLGRSYVSPNFSDGTYLLYGQFPTLPGYSDTTTENSRGSDVGAMAWQHVPYVMVQHRSLFEDHELPLWNRNNSCGNPLLGQGQSMVGDPLNLVPVIFNGAAWAFDLKYVLVRWLFGFGLGLTVWQATRHRAAALLTCCSGIFIGFFLYRVNHPAHFSLCVAPWILYTWLRIVQAPDLRSTLRWVGGLLIANWCELNSGTVKEAYMLLLCLQFTGALLLAWARIPLREKLQKLGAAAGGGVVFAMISAPIWTTFLRTLSLSHTNYDNPSALQILPSLLLGLFDEIFYRPFHKGEFVWNPSLNFFAGIAVLYVFATWRRATRDPIKSAMAVGALVPFAMAFGVIPPQWIIRLPLVGNIGHIDNTFSCVVIVHLLVLAGIGCSLAAQRLRTPEARGDLIVTGVLLAVIVVPYFAMTHTVHREPFGANTVKTFLRWGEVVPVTAFVGWSLAVLLLASVALASSARRLACGTRHAPAWAILGFTALLVMFWRHGAHGRIGFDDYTYNPADRVDLHAPSRAIEAVRAAQTEPSRVMGIDGSLMAGWSTAYRMEGPGGADAIMNRWYRELLHACHVELAWDWVVPARTSRMQQDLPFFDFLNVRHYVVRADDPARLAPGLQRIQQADLDVYASATTWPRAFFTDRLAIYPHIEAFGKMVLNGDGRPFAAMQASDRHSTMSDDMTTRTVVPATDYSLTPNTTTFSVTAPSAGMIVLHEAWWDGDFQVTVNGKRANYVRVNHAFKGVEVDAPGTYEVRFAYWPRHFTLALWLAGAGMAVIAIVAWLVWPARVSPAA